MDKKTIKLIETPCKIHPEAVRMLEEIGEAEDRRRGELARMFLYHGLAAYLSGTTLDALDNPFRTAARQRLTMDDLMREKPDGKIKEQMHSYKNST